MDDFDFNFDLGGDVPIYTDTPDFSFDLDDLSGGDGGWFEDLTDFIGGIDLQQITDLAKAAISINAAYQAAGQPTPRVSSSNAVVNTNGTVTTKSSTGQTVTARMAVGTPYIAANGSILTNNGNGTYTIVNTNGSTQTLPYPASTGAGGVVGGSGISPETLKMLGYGALGLGALYFLTQNSRRRG